MKESEIVPWMAGLQNREGEVTKGDVAPLKNNLQPPGRTYKITVSSLELNLPGLS